MKNTISDLAECNMKMEKLLQEMAKKQNIVIGTEEGHTDETRSFI